MCGIVGLFLKDRSLEPQLGALLSDMLIIMTDRGPDSAGIAIYGSAASGKSKVTLQSANPALDFEGPCRRTLFRRYPGNCCGEKHSCGR